MTMAAGKELRKFAKDNDRRIVAMTFYTRCETKCEMVGSVASEDIPKVAKLWKRILELSRTGLPTK